MRVHVAEELLAVLADLLRLVHGSVSESRRFRTDLQRLLELRTDLIIKLAKLLLILLTKLVQVFLCNMQHPLKVLQMHCQFDLGNLFFRID